MSSTNQTRLKPIHGDTIEQGNISPFCSTMEHLEKNYIGSARRKEIWKGFLKLRDLIAAAGIKQGYQWIGGSFISNLPDPNDIDVVTLFIRPAGLYDEYDLQKWRESHSNLHNSSCLKTILKVDHNWIDLGYPAYISGPAMVYWSQVLSHDKKDKWCGFVQVPLGDGTTNAVIS